MSKISLFPEGKVSTKTGKLSPSVIPFTNIEFDDYLEKIKDGEFQDEVLKYRTGKIEKLRLRGVTASGVFSYRSTKNLLSHSGFICIDVDQKDQLNLDFNQLKEELKKDAYVYSFHTSVGGFGLAIYIKIVSEKHFESAVSLEKYFLDNYKVIVDKSCKNVDRYRFVSYDPDTYINKKAKVCLINDHLVSAMQELVKNNIVLGTIIEKKDKNNYLLHGKKVNLSPSLTNLLGVEYL